MAGVLAVLLVLALASSIANGYSTTPNKKKTTSFHQTIRVTPRFTTLTTSAHSSSIISSSTTTASTSSPIAIVNRGTFLQTFLLSSSSIMLLTQVVQPPQAAYAKDVDPAIKGTKKDPEFEGCLGKCLYDCTKPKGMEQKSRMECIPECKAKCATNKAQLMLGTAK